MTDRFFNDTEHAYECGLQDGIARERKSAVSAAATADCDLARETRAAEALRQSLAAQGADVNLTRDMIEGETSLHDCIARVMDEIRETEILTSGLTDMIKELHSRKEMFENRIEHMRASVEHAMMVGELRTLTLPDCTVTLKSVPPKLEVTDEAAIPAQYWKPSDPKLDRKAVADALKAGEAVPGAVMGNGSQTLQVRRT